MLQNYFKIAFRSLLKNRLISGINILGLSIGLVCCLLILLYVQDELSYDRHHEKADRIYRVVKDFVDSDGERLPDATTPPALAPALAADLPEVSSVVRLFPSWGGRYLFRSGERSFYEEQVMRADSSIFDLFDFTFLEGNPATALRTESDIVLTASAAQKYFGNISPIGQELTLTRNQGNLLFRVAAVIEDLPANSHFDFDFLLPIPAFFEDINNNWGFYNFYTYVLLKENTNIASVEPKIQSVYQKNVEEGRNIFYTQPLTDIHLKSNLKWELAANGDIKYVQIFLLIAFMILTIAVVNYINLATAKSATRSREVGVRKVIGAQRKTLMAQFLSESVLTTLLSMVFAVLAVEAILPFFNELTGKEMTLLGEGNWLWLFGLFGFALFIGLLAGVYPGFYLSSFQPVKVLKGFQISGDGAFLRKGLVVFQFTIAAGLIAGAWVVYNQLNFIANKHLGFEKEQVVVINNIGSLANKEVVKQQLRNQENILNVGTSSAILGGLNATTTLAKKGAPENEGTLVNYSFVDYNFIPTLGIEMQEGRNFSTDFPQDSVNAIVINELAAKELGLPQPYVGQQIILDRSEDSITYVNVIGVTKDFHFASLRNDIRPYAFFFNPDNTSRFNVKIASDNYQQTIAQLESTWTTLVPDRPLDYFFLDDNFEKLHQADQNFRTVFTGFTILTIFIACLGLLALVTFSVERRIKEIGIRKVLGSSISEIVFLLSKDFLRLIILAVAIACPLAWLVMQNWLNNFAYHIEMNAWMFVITILGTVGIALLAISYHAIKAAFANPVEALKYE